MSSAIHSLSGLEAGSTGVTMSGEGKSAILVVEDEQDLRMTVAEVLRMEGYTVETASHGREALEVLEGGGRPELILLDVMMPVMDGHAFRRRQLEEPEYADIPVLLFTSSKEADPEEFEAVGVLRKPVGIDDLVRAVNEHIPERESRLGK